MPLPLIAAGLALLPKLPELWDSISGIFGMETPKSVKQAADLAGQVGSILSRGDATPEQTEKIQLAMLAHTERIRELELEERKAELQDTANARAREIATGDWTPRLLAFLILLGWLFINVHCFTESIPALNRELVARLLGTLDAALMLMLGYYFGSSHRKGGA